MKEAVKQRRVLRGTTSMMIAIVLSSVLTAAAWAGVGPLAGLNIGLVIPPLVLRGIRPGIYLQPDRLLAKDWFRTYVIERNAVVTADTKPYTGFYNGYDPLEISRLWKSLQIKWITSGRVKRKRLRSTLTSRRRCNEACFQIGLWMRDDREPGSRA